MPDRWLMKALGLQKEHDPEPQAVDLPTDEDGKPVNAGELAVLRADAETKARATRAVLPGDAWSEQEGKDR